MKLLYNLKNKKTTPATCPGTRETCDRKTLFWTKGKMWYGTQAGNKEDGGSRKVGRNEEGYTRRDNPLIKKK
jgi:hypothetical protein